MDPWHYKYTNSTCDIYASLCSLIKSGVQLSRYDTVQYNMTHYSSGKVGHSPFWEFIHVFLGLSDSKACRLVSQQNMISCYSYLSTPLSSKQYLLQVCALEINACITQCLSTSIITNTLMSNPFPVSLTPWVNVCIWQCLKYRDVIHWIIIPTLFHMDINFLRDQHIA